MFGAQVFFLLGNRLQEAVLRTSKAEANICPLHELGKSTLLLLTLSLVTRVTVECSYAALLFKLESEKSRRC